MTTPANPDNPTAQEVLNNLAMAAVESASVEPDSPLTLTNLVGLAMVLALVNAINDETMLVLHQRIVALENRLNDAEADLRRVRNW